MNSFLMKPKNLSAIELRERKRNSVFSRFSKTWQLDVKIRTKTKISTLWKIRMSKIKIMPGPELPVVTVLRLIS